MGYYARLKHGARYIELDGGDYSLGMDYTPPAPVSNPLISRGNMLNRYSGGQRVDRSFSDRPMNLPLHVTGDSASETHNAVRRLASFIEVAMNDSAEPLYFVFGESNDVPYEPLWGQQFKYYEIKDATDALNGLYGIASIREQYIFVNLAVITSPLAVGKRQLVGSATGGVLEHTWATPDGISRGLALPEAATNYITNPIFGHGTWNNDWADAASLTDEENTDMEYVLFGSSSAKLTATDSANNHYEFTYTAGNTSNHTFSVYCKKQDGSAVTTADVNLFYAAANMTETVVAYGDGWYRVYGKEAGVESPQSLRIYVTDGVTIYVDGIQFEVNEYPSEFCYGDMLDCAWTGTAHDSSTTRTEARWRIPTADAVNANEGTIRLAWMPKRTQAEITADVRLIDATDDNFYSRFRGGTNLFNFLVGGTTVTSSAQTFTATDTIILHYVWGSGEVSLYIDGAVDGTSASFTMPTLDANLYLGTTTGVAENANGTFSDLTIFDRALTATEISNDYNNIQEHINGGDTYGQRLNPIPWLWTDDGDGVLDNYYDATHEDFCVSGGIPGNINADTLWQLKHSDTGEGIAISNFPADIYCSLTDLFEDHSGHGDAGALGAEVEQITVDTTADLPSAYPQYQEGTTNDYLVSRVMGLPFVMFCSLSDAGSGLKIAGLYGYGSFVHNSEWKTITTDTTRRNYWTYSVPTPQNLSEKYDWMVKNGFTWSVYLLRTSGSDTVELDYQRVMIGDFCYIVPTLTGQVETIIMHEGAAYGYTSALRHTENINFEGDAIELYPNSLNHTVMVVGTKATATDRTDTITISRLYVKPRWLAL